MPSSAASRSYRGRSAPSPIRRSPACGHPPRGPPRALVEVEPMDRGDDDRHAGRPRGDPTHGPGDGAVGVDEVRLQAPEQAREAPGRAGQGAGRDPARRIDDRDGKTPGPEEIDVVPGAADDPVLDRGWPMKIAHPIE